MRFGYACKTVTDSKELTESLNEKCTTVTWLNKQKRDVAETRLIDIAKHNAQYLKKALEFIVARSQKYPQTKMFRIGSGVLPAYTHPDWKYFWQQQHVKTLLEKWLSPVGEYARSNDIRLSMHPNQYVCLASDRQEVIDRSIEEFEYHTDVVKYLGYGKSFQDFKCNVHIGGRLGPEEILKSYNKLSPEARNIITIENDEMSWGLDSILELEKTIPLVLDIHHHLIHSSGEYIMPDDDRVKRVIDSWRGIRPVLHYSSPRQEEVSNYKNNELIDIKLLFSQGAKKQKLRAHSDYYWHKASNDWAMSFIQFDIMCEAKMKNLAVDKLLGT